MSNTGHNGTVDERLDALRSTAAADDRLRLIHLFMWTALVAACLAFSRWIGEPYPKSETRNFIVITWLSIAWATALAVFPWLVARRRRKPSSPLQPGERLWVIMGLFSLLRAGAVWGHDLLKIAGELLLSGGYDDVSYETEERIFVAFFIAGSLALVFTVSVLARRAHPSRWRVALAALALALAIELAGGIYLELTSYGIVSSGFSGWNSLGFYVMVLAGYPSVLAAPAILYAMARDAASRGKEQYGWRHWVGGLTYLAIAAFFVVALTFDL